MSKVTIRIYCVLRDRGKEKGVKGGERQRMTEEQNEERLKRITFTSGPALLSLVFPSYGRFALSLLLS